MFHQHLQIPPSMPNAHIAEKGRNHAGEFSGDSLDLLFECQALGCGLGSDLLVFMPSVRNADLDLTPQVGWVRRLLGF